MIRETLLVTRAFLRLHTSALTIYLSLEAFALCLFHHWYRQQAVAKIIDHKEFWLSTEFQISAAVLLSLIVASAVLLAWSFHPRRVHSWLRLLPISKQVLLVVPSLLLILNSTFIGLGTADFWLWEVTSRSHASALFLFVLPFGLFITLRNFKQLWIGMLAFGVLSAVFFVQIYATPYGFSDWQKTRGILEAELFFIALLAIYARMIERETKRLAFIVCASLSVIPLARSYWPYVKTPVTLLETISALKYYPRQPVIERFKQFAKDPDSWTDFDFTPMTFPGRTLHWNVHTMAYKFLNDEERLSLTELVLDHPEKFEVPARGGSKISFHPIGEGLVATGTSALLARRWQDQQVYCWLADATINAGQVVPLAKFIDNCDDINFHRLLYVYKPWRPNNFNDEFEELILRSKDLPLKLRKKLADMMIDTSALKNADSHTRADFRSTIVERGLSQSGLDAWKKGFFISQRDLLRPHLHSASNLRQWVQEVNAFNSGAGDSVEYVESLILVCELVAFNCLGPSDDIFSDLNALQLTSVIIINNTYFLHKRFDWGPEHPTHAAIKRRILSQPNLEDALLLAKPL